MSHLSQLVSEAIANGRVSPGKTPVSEVAQDRVKIEFEGETHYVVCLKEAEMEIIHQNVPDAYVLRDKFVV